MAPQSILGGRLERLAAIATVWGAGSARPILQMVNGKRQNGLAATRADGNRTVRLRRLLRNAGFSTVYDVGEGIFGRSDASVRFGGSLPVEHRVKRWNPVSVKREYVQ